MNITFNKNTYLIMDRSPINFKGVEFNVVKFNENEIGIKLTKKGIEQYKNSVLNRTHKFGDDKYLIDFLTKELNGEIEYSNQEEEYEIFAKQMKDKKFKVIGGFTVAETYETIIKAKNKEDAEKKALLLDLSKWDDCRSENMDSMSIDSVEESEDEK